SAAQMAQDAAGGRIPVLVASIAATRAVVEAGKLRWLAISSTKRFPTLPDVPTMNEIVPGVIMDGWFVLVAPTGVAADVIVRMNREIGEFLKGPGIQERLAGFGL